MCWNQGRVIMMYIATWYLSTLQWTLQLNVIQKCYSIPQVINENIQNSKPKTEFIELWFRLKAEHWGKSYILLCRKKELLFLTEHWVKGAFEINHCMPFRETSFTDQLMWDFFPGILKFDDHLMTLYVSQCEDISTGYTFCRMMRR